jgi:signal transduction histidine kinase
MKLNAMKRFEHLASRTVRQNPRWRRYGIDSLLAVGGVALVTGVILLAHLYPRIPTISFAYLLAVLALASARGLYAAILASLLAFFAFLYFLVPPLFTFIIPSVEDWLTLFVFLVTAIITGQLASALRRHAEQAQNREREIRLLYSQAQELATLQERQRLARELHDSVSQALYGISLGAHTAREALANDPEQAASSLDYVLSLTEAGLAEMRALIFELRPESLAMEGLVAALNKQVAVLRTRFELVVDAELGDEPDLTLEQKQALYRIAQEALHNTVKHARASCVRLTLTNKTHKALLEIRDDGRGFDPAGVYPGHLGLRSMHERIAKIGGSITIDSAPGQGTSIKAQVPLTQEGHTSVLTYPPA